MRRLRLALILLIVFTLSGCSNSIDEQVSFNDRIVVDDYHQYYDGFYASEYKYEIINDYESNTIDFEFFVFTDEWVNEDYFYSSYGYSVSASEEVTLNLACSNEILDVTFTPDNELNYTSVIENNRFARNCETSEEVMIVLTSNDEDIFTDSFIYEDGMYFDISLAPSYSPSSFDSSFYAYLLLGGLVLISLTVIMYRVYYKYRINKQLGENKTKRVRLLDIWTIISITSVTVVIIGLTLLVVSRREYDNTHYESLYITETSYVELDVNFDALELTDVNVIVYDDELMSWYNKGTDIDRYDLDILDDLDQAYLIDVIEFGFEQNLCLQEDSFSCVYYGPIYGIRIGFTDGVNVYDLAFELDGSGNVSYLSIMSGNATLTSIPADYFTESFDELLDIVNDALQEQIE